MEKSSYKSMYKTNKCIAISLIVISVFILIVGLAGIKQNQEEVVVEKESVESIDNNIQIQSIPIPTLKPTPQVETLISSREKIFVREKTEISRGNISRDSVQKEVKSDRGYTDYELDLVARVINAEAGRSTDTDYHQQLIASVIVNRVASKRFPNTIKEVVYQQGQYQCTWNGAIKKPLTERAVKNAKFILDGNRVIQDDVIWQSTKKQGIEEIVYIQGHSFCR